MTYANAHQKVTRWLTESQGVASADDVLDGKGCCHLSREGEDLGIIMLPPNESTLYFLTSLYSPDAESDGDLLAFCLGLNAYSLVTLKTAAIGLDTDGRQLVLKSAHPIHADVTYDFDGMLADFLELAAQTKQHIRQFRHSRSDDTPEQSATDNAQLMQNAVRA